VNYFTFAAIVFGDEEGRIHPYFGIIVGHFPFAFRPESWAISCARNLSVSRSSSSRRSPCGSFAGGCLELGRHLV
jgi:hypothetical protein